MVISEFAGPAQVAILHGQGINVVDPVGGAG